MAEEVNGLSSLLMSLQGISDNIADNLETAVTAGAKVVEDEAKDKVRKRTGNLAESITHQTEKKTKEEVTVLVGPGPKGWYGRFLEYGTSKMPAYPFLRPALDESGDKVEQAIGNEIEKIISRAVRP